MKKLLTFLLTLLTYTAFAQISFFKELNTEEDGSYPYNFIEINGTTFFLTYELGLNKLWKTDGTESGTVQVTDQPIYSNLLFPTKESLYSLNNELYYIVRDISESNTISLWKTNGIERTLVLDTANTIGKPYFFNNEIYFVNTQGLFKINNGESILIKSLPTNTSIPNGYEMTIVNNQLIFFTILNNGGAGAIFQVWESDGTNSGTTIIHSIDKYLGFINSNNQTYLLGNYLYFIVKKYFITSDNSSEKTVIELWKTDGSQTSFVKTILENNYFDYGAQTSSLGSFNNHLIFIVNNTKLWLYDSLTDNINLLRTFSSIPPDDLYDKKWGVLDTKFYFSAKENNDLELWESDGTVNGTFLSKDINPVGSSDPNFFTNINNRIFFRANTNELWQTDGTEAGTVFLQTIATSADPTDIPRKPEFIYTSNNQLLFSNYDVQHNHELWKSDGTLQNTELLKNIVTYSKGSLASDKKIKVGNVWFFNGKDYRGGELWKTDGTDAGTVIVKDINPGTSGVIFQEMAAVGNTIYFTVRYTNENVTRLFKSDGTESGTSEIPLSNGTSYLVNPYKLIATTDKLFFLGLGSSSYRLWASDGTEIGTYPIQAITSTDGIYNTLTAVGNKVFFNSNGLWVSDGTQNGTYKIFNDPVGAPSTPTCLIEFKNKLYFLSSYFKAGSGGKDALYESDGTVEGTKIIKDFESNERLLSTVNLFLQKTDNRLFFRTGLNFGSPNYSFNLWTSDGTTQGTYQLKTINFEHYFPELSFANVNSQFYFFSIAGGLENNLTIWTSDGTVDGTTQISQKTTNSYVLSTINFYGKLFFSYYDLEHGTELFKTNQTNTGISLAGEIRNGSKNSFVRNLMDFPDKILFWGRDETHGSEIWQYLPMDCEGNRNYTKQSGSWASSDTWTCGRVPNFGDIVLIKSGHSVSVPNNFNAQTKSLTTQPGAVLDIPKSSILLVKP